MPSKEKSWKAIFFIADISGYTRYMLESRTGKFHGELIVGQLVESIIKEAKLPFKISKLEGDAIFMYVDKVGKIDKAFKKRLGKNVIAFFKGFFSRLEILKVSMTCNCGACGNVGRLDLKMVIHSGNAVLHKVGTFEELSGVDVIIVHRLLKNEVKGHRYILLTDSAMKDVELPMKEKPLKGDEKYDHIGKVGINTYFPSNKEMGLKD